MYMLLHISYASLCVFIVRIACIYINGMYVNAINVSGSKREYEYKKFRICSFIHSFKSNIYLTLICLSHGDGSSLFREMILR